MKARKRKTRKLGMVVGTCRVKGEKDVLLDSSGICEACGQIFEEIDRRHSSRKGIRRDMQEYDVPLGGGGGGDEDY